MQRQVVRGVELLARHLRGNNAALVAMSFLSVKGRAARALLRATPPVGPGSRVMGCLRVVVGLAAEVPLKMLDLPSLLMAGESVGATSVVSDPRRTPLPMRVFDLTPASPS